MSNPNVVYSFEITIDNTAQLDAWLKIHDKTCAYVDPRNQSSIGGRLTYTFTPTSIGTLSKVVCACGADVDLTNFEMLQGAYDT